MQSKLRALFAFVGPRVPVSTSFSRDTFSFVVCTTQGRRKAGSARSSKPGPAVYENHPIKKHRF